jgi:hypothetical protein
MLLQSLLVLGAMFSRTTIRAEGQQEMFRVGVDVEARRHGSWQPGVITSHHRHNKVSTNGTKYDYGYTVLFEHLRSRKNVADTSNAMNAQENAQGDTDIVMAADIRFSEDFPGPPSDRADISSSQEAIGVMGQMMGVSAARVAMNDLTSIAGKTNTKVLRVDPGHRFGICIIGQLSRLELKTKIERLIAPSRTLWEGRVDVVLVLDPASEKYVNPDVALRGSTEMAGAKDTQTMPTSNSSKVPSSLERACKVALQTAARYKKGSSTSASVDGGRVGRNLMVHHHISPERALKFCAVAKSGQAVGHTIVKRHIGDVATAGECCMACTMSHKCLGFTFGLQKSDRLPVCLLSSDTVLIHTIDPRHQSLMGIFGGAPPRVCKESLRRPKLLDGCKSASTTPGACSASIRSEIGNAASNVLVMFDTQSELGTTVRRHHVVGEDKPERAWASRVERATQHVRRWRSAARCWSGLEEIERATGGSYERYMMLRDDSVFMEQFPVGTMAVDGVGPGAQVQSCLDWMGVSDKILLLNGRKAGRAGIQGPFATYHSPEDFLRVKTKVVTEAKNGMMNPEKYYKHVLEDSDVLMTRTYLPVLVGRNHPLTGLFCLDCSRSGFDNGGACIRDLVPTTDSLPAPALGMMCIACPRNLKYAGYRWTNSKPVPNMTMESIMAKPGPTPWRAWLYYLDKRVVSDAQKHLEGYDAFHIAGLTLLNSIDVRLVMRLRNIDPMIPSPEEFAEHLLSPGVKLRPFSNQSQMCKKLKWRPDCSGEI